uniref:Sucrose phosphatase-like domain-containing protein n=1 Tax=Pyramimonas obovata TaxID=1411642 RepID=A0A7S0WP63_9CHLO|mmetsp:Transcript_32979/g.71891  ORF Transcript_32979/g.71891 Transcript_32979/m.71891 type:complete len:329 (+) Transcript_32979:185-1171(+)|eukprot:CAMPEP_0118923146 /NCGR_PEP_ID=MMETSP1169-20130426/1781_1 /TAXON_ID=36882 /ORGANISM="Pyramimonas obovata, Strain CCMP722" /LENGTH=328 /DNA_ID=CAMNT_0006864093 /DNA_START=178 /DNA_END=1164 /DNA_ORIENTATION=+
MAEDNKKKIKIVFSDIDGTFVHYPKKLEGLGRIEEDPNSPTGLHFVSKASGACHPLIALPASSTGQQGFLSLETLKMVRKLREAGIQFAIITGARYATVLERVPYLPLADAIIVENGGRIFEQDPDLLTFFKEDHAWRATQTPTVGSVHEARKPPADRKGLLWDSYRKLHADGWTVDAQSYTTLFRVKGGDKDPAELEQFIASLPEGLASSVNLGMADIYPSTSGKHSATRYLTEKKGFTADEVVCMCDDDNDLKMAEYCSHAYLPGMNAPSVVAAAKAKPEHYTPGKMEGIEGTHEALLFIMARCGIEYKVQTSTATSVDAGGCSLQ